MVCYVMNRGINGYRTVQRLKWTQNLAEAAGEKMKHAILVVSFGTGCEETRKRTIDRIEHEIQTAYPDSRVYRAWTSGVIRRRLLERGGIRIPDVRGAMEQMHRDGIRTVIVQPTYVLDGMENERMIREIHAKENCFAQVVTGDPLLTSREDLARVARAVAERFPLGEREALVLMGHGTEHCADEVYTAMDGLFREMGCPNIYTGAMKGSPTVESILRRIEKAAPEKVILAPFLITAGAHAANDLAGDAPASWKNRFARAGCQVECVLEGLGEYDEVRKLFVEHVGASMRKLSHSPLPESCHLADKFTCLPMTEIQAEDTRKKM